MTSPGIPLEIERKFLVRMVPGNLTAYPHAAIRQGYLAADADGTTVRLRQAGSHYYITVKGLGDIARPEAEVDLTQAQFDALWPFTKRRRVEKVRYEIPLGSLTISLDAYEGALAGLYTAEVEFESIESAEAFQAPVWFGEDVSRDRRYRNLILASEGIPRD